MEVTDFIFDDVSRKGSDKDYAVYYTRGNHDGENDLWVQAVEYFLDGVHYWSVLYMSMEDGDILDSVMYRRITEDEACDLLIRKSEKTNLVLKRRPDGN